jgi:hypothetical protein
VRHPILIRIAACACLSIPASGVLAEEAGTMSTHVGALGYTHLYSDANGVSHFRDEKFTFKPAPSPTGTPGDQALSSSELAGAHGATLLALKPGAFEDWHKAPRRMFLIALQGTSEVTAGDGEKRRFGPGSIVLMDDTTGKGHITRVVGTVGHVALTVPVAAEGPAAAAAPAK